MIWMSDWAVRWATGLPHFNQALISQVGSLPGYCSSLLSGACRGSLLLVCLIWEMLSDVPVNCSSFPGLKLHAGRESSPDSLTWVPHESKPRGERTARSLQFLQGMACSCLCLRYLLLQKCLQTHCRKPLNMAEQLSHFHFKMGYAEKESWEVLESGNKGKHFLPLLLFSCSVVSYSLRPHELQHARLPCPSPSAGVCSNSCSLSQWCHPTTSSSVTPFSCPQSFPPSVSFPMNWFLTSGGQSIGASASESVLEFSPQTRIFRSDFLYDVLVGSPCSPKDFQESSPTPQFKAVQILRHSAFFTVQLTSIHDYQKNHSLTDRPLLAKSCHCFLIHCLFYFLVLVTS